jgi:hypothetical protein
MRLYLTKEELGKENEGSGKGLEIAIEGIKGDPSEKSPGTSVFIEHWIIEEVLELMEDFG